MKRILVILAEFYPYPSSNTNCIEPFLYGLLNEGYEVDVVTRRHAIDLPPYENYKGLNIIRIDDYKTMNTIAYNSLIKNNSSRVLKQLNKWLSIISKTLFYMYYRDVRGEERYGGWDTKEVLRKCNELNEMKQYDYILSISHPAVTHKIANILKDQFTNKVQWAIFEFDPFAYNEDTYGKYNKKKRILQECGFFEKCDKVFLTPELFEFYKETPLNEYSNKFCKVNFPNMSEISADIGKSILMKSGKISDCVYGGALMKSIRNPVFMIRFFHELKGTVSITMMSSSKVKFLKNEFNGMKDTLKFYSGQPKEIAHATMIDADILINIGNTVVFQTPGKIFEYMAMGKPIIHFSKIENDPSLKYLEKYPMLLVIKEYEYDKEREIEACKKFIAKYSGKTLTFDKVLKYMPELNSAFIVEKFVEEMNSL
ncbi:MULTISPECIES: hypothetical protein [Paenibacillus]|uniref:Uncharacterized protein n=1 Tax=Paenibacillus odorifer TaxID=189426 RepID=A0ABX3HCG0_9BACL|nr:hypothetical protein [Paenibacillus odorifer]OMD46964.1 hypothetical protein BSK51_25820 [Paenibacillus odorifer]